MARSVLLVAAAVLCVACITAQLAAATPPEEEAAASSYGVELAPTSPSQEDRVCRPRTPRAAAGAMQAIRDCHATLTVLQHEGLLPWSMAELPDLLAAAIPAADWVDALSPDDALEAGRAAALENLENPAPMLVLGVVLLMRDMDELGREALLRAITLLDGGLQQLDSDPWVLHARNHSVPLAASADEVKHHLMDLQAHAYNLFGRAQFDRTDWLSAIDALERAIELLPSVPEAFEWLARAYDRAGMPYAFMRAWRSALQANPTPADRNVWPVYCQSLQLAREGHSLPPGTPALSMEVEAELLERLATEEVRAVGVATAPRPMTQFVALRDTVAAMRRLECSPHFVARRNRAMHRYMADQPTRPYSHLNFAYGQVYFQGWHMLFRRRPVRAAMERAGRLGLRHVVLGSNVGTEVLYAAATFGNVKVVGYDVLCPLVDVARRLRRQHGLRNAEFVCGDALDADLSDAAVVLVDNQAWDRPLLRQLVAKLQREMVPGAVLVEYASADDSMGVKLGPLFAPVGCETVDVSWLPQLGTTVAMFRKRLAPAVRAPYEYTHYTSELRAALRSAQAMAEDVPAALHGPLPFPEGPAALHRLVATLQRDDGGELLAYRGYADAVMSAFQRMLFNWHCHRFYDLTQHLQPDEVAYVEAFIKRAGEEHRNFVLTHRWHGNRMSSFTYSHRVRGAALDSARFRAGTTSGFEQLERLATPVLRRRGITLLDDIRASNASSAFAFYGLGWDMAKEEFKLYLMTDRLDALPQHFLRVFRESLEPISAMALHPYSLLSVTYAVPRQDRDGRAVSAVVEEKLYVYPERMADVQRLGIQVEEQGGAVAGSVAVMLSTERGYVAQFDLDTSVSCRLRQGLNDVGRRVTDAYSDVGLFLETMTYEHPDSFTLYFPSGSG